MNSGKKHEKLSSASDPAPEQFLILWSRSRSRCKSGGAGAGADGAQIFGAGAVPGSCGDGDGGH